MLLVISLTGADYWGGLLRNGITKLVCVVQEHGMSQDIISGMSDSSLGLVQPLGFVYLPTHLKEPLLTPVISSGTNTLCSCCWGAAGSKESTGLLRLEGASGGLCVQPLSLLSTGPPEPGAHLSPDDLGVPLVTGAPQIHSEAVSQRSWGACFAPVSSWPLACPRAPSLPLPFSPEENVGMTLPGDSRDLWSQLWQKK